MGVRCQYDADSNIPGPHAVYAGVTRDAPLEAEFEEVRTQRSVDGQTARATVLGTIRRDRQGRVRIDRRVAALETTFEVTSIWDPVERRVGALDPEGKTVLWRRVGVEHGQGSAWLFFGPWRVEETAEQREFEQFSCRKVALGPEGANAGEEVGQMWISDELNQVVFERVDTAEGQYSWRLYNIRRREPKPELFRAPLNYKILSGEERQ